MTRDAPTRTREAFWIGGHWARPLGDGAIDVVDPSTERPLGSVPAGTAADAEAAAAAARQALPRWSATPVSERLGFLERLVAGLSARADELADVLTAEVGAPVAMARRTQVGLAVALAASYLDITRDFAFERRVGNSLVLREPAGVVATITPWNVPLLLTLQKVVPALMAGCTVVHKPSELTPLHAYLLTEVIAECDLPPGVFNLVVGEGPVVGAELARTPDVDLVSLTGSTRAGRAVAAIGAERVKRIHLELGGKNAAILLDDLDDAGLESAVRACVDQMCFNTGQACLQWSRLLVPADRHDEVVEFAARCAREYRVGDPRDPATDLGPLVSAAALARVRAAVVRAVEEGARLATGGPGRPEGLNRGYYVSPTVLGGVDPSMAVAQEEVFGPVLSVMPYDGEDEAVRIADGTPYGLHGAVWSANTAHAQRVARRLRTGQVDINGGPFNVRAPFGGYRQSGVGRECGEEGLDGFCEIKSLQLPSAPVDSVDSAGPVVPTGPRLRDAS
ncbi:aldehyde dehydrogenase family protein [Streptomyces sp. CB01580]|uniref:aldehyde dehydrogenase family protein n=1 Tax=Streptomyces sp. CB01580 TaxID=1703933 RepID=UPI00093D6E3A|nr:aldehyde dehydrogenase family protein [Streptomyces sp. CB01580]OKJ29730.1 aldehyde dehydrogenase [Streptomyces sp. CB01580]